MKDTKQWMAALVLWAMAGAPALVWAQDHAAHGDHGASATVAGNEDMTRGEIRKWDAAQNKVTLRHEEIKNLMMPPMTMVFVVKNPQQMQGLKVGDKVVFEAVDQDGRAVIKEIRKP